MDQQRNKLLELMETLSFPLTEAEMQEKVKGLTDEEVTDLISVYSDVVEYEDALEDYVRENNPEEYKKLLDERDQSIKKKDKEVLYDLEKIQEEEDIKLDAEDIKLEREIEEAVSEQETVAELMEGIQEDVSKALVTSELPNPSENASNQANAN
jgi:hypothetical protein